MDIVKLAMRLHDNSEVGNMSVMAPKKKKPVDDKAPPDRMLVRMDDPRLIAALDAYAEATRRSRNMATIVLLEEGLKLAGFWPPPKGE